METDSALSSYHIFNAVAEAGNISKAAKALYISQPAISRAVSKLEQNLSVKLFIRNSRGVHLTEEGQLLYEHTKTAFESLKKGEENLRRIHGLGISQLRIGVSSTLCKYILIPYLQHFIERYPHIQLNVQCHPAQKTISLLQEGALDIGLICGSGCVAPLDFLPVTEIEGCFVATESYLKNLQIREQNSSFSSENTVQKRRRPSRTSAADFSLTALKHGNLLLLEDREFSCLHQKDYLEQYSVKPEHLLNVSSMDLLIDFTRIGLGIGLAAKEFIKEELDAHTLLELPLPEKIKKESVGFAYRKTSLQTESVKKFIDFYQQEKEKEDPFHEAQKNAHENTF